MRRQAARLGYCELGSAIAITPGVGALVWWPKSDESGRSVRTQVRPLTNAWHSLFSVMDTRPRDAVTRLKRAQGARRWRHRAGWSKASSDVTSSFSGGRTTAP